MKGKIETGFETLSGYSIGEYIKKDFLGNYDLLPYSIEGHVRLLEKIDFDDSFGTSIIRIYLDNNKYFVEPLEFEFIPGMQAEVKNDLHFLSSEKTILSIIHDKRKDKEGNIWYLRYYFGQAFASPRWIMENEIISWNKKAKILTDKEMLKSISYYYNGERNKQDIENESEKLWNNVIGQAHPA
jgi:hypothetical protein